MVLPNVKLFEASDTFSKNSQNLNPSHEDQLKPDKTVLHIQYRESQSKTL